ncbi:Transposase [Anaerovirgula multivorans]|uniref:Transposase n=1 Tax=Anaerovirgula multivorans TaxID=312168 RepID=A0A239KKU9_9FIRM|nr:transposase [Anaerovirgula multivorans]SNT17804.1 Transposase [Anaerovirgula multivorans]
MNTNYDIIRNLIGLQGLEIIYTNVNNGIFEVFAKSAFDFAKCPHCRHITYFTLTSKEDVASFLAYYKDLVAEYDIPELEKFVKTLDNWMEYILNYYDYPISNGTTEGNNHKVKNIKRRAYGYRNRSNWEIRVKYEFQCA